MQILGSGMSARMWEVTVEHARTCILTDQVHVYYPDNQRKTGFIFNDVGEVLGVLSEQRLVSVNDLPDDERVCTFLVPIAVVTKSYVMFLTCHCLY